MHSDAMTRYTRDSRLTAVRSSDRTPPRSAEFVSLAHLRKLSECEQAAAVCYRVRGHGIEFLLVRTRGGGRWTFPKGSAEPGLTHAQAAALEAFEEAGVHGRIEEASFTGYVRRKRGEGKNYASRSDEKEVAVKAYLCEVLRLSPPQESKRDRTWFSVEDARRLLREGHKNNGGAAFARVVDRAVARIQRLRGRIGLAERPQADRAEPDRPQLHASQKDALQRVQFDFAETYGRGAEVSFTPHIRRRLGDMRRSSVPIVDGHPREVLQGEVLEFPHAREKKSKALGTGTKDR